MHYGGKNFRNYIEYFLHLFLYSLCTFLWNVFDLRELFKLICICFILCLFVENVCVFVVMVFWICCNLMCICCISCVIDVSHVYLLYSLYCCSYLNPGLMARSQNPECPATGHVDTDFSWFPCVYKRMLRWFPSFQLSHVALPP